jgi:integrase
MSVNGFIRADSIANDMQDNISSLKDTIRPEKCARTSQVAPRSKTDLKFWQRKIFKPVYARSDGTRVQAANYAVEISFRGRRIKWTLVTPNREAAAARAKELYLYISANGWEAARERYRPKEAHQPRDPDITVGEFLRQARGTSELQSRTLDGYSKAFRRIVSGVAGIKSSNKKFDRFGGGYDQWTGKVDAVKLSEITPEAIQGWKREFLSAAKPDPISQRSARVSLNSYLRRAKCLFSQQILKHLDLRLPDPLPFAGIAFEKRPSLKYHSNFDVRLLVAEAKEELAGSGEIELFKIFLLAAMCGLRRHEIDLLPWRAFRWEEGILRIEATEFFHPKSEDSLADIPLDPELVSLFRGYYARAKSEFVIESDALAPSPGASYSHYRCLGLFQKLSAWLRSHGVKTVRPLHTLRKEFGSLINQTHGIHAASRALRHASIGITAEIYVDSRVRTTSGLGYLLVDQQKALPIERREAESAAGQ